MEKNNSALGILFSVSTPTFTNIIISLLKKGQFRKYANKGKILKTVHSLLKKHISCNGTHVGVACVIYRELVQC